jgi:hypothetical protein
VTIDTQPQSSTITRGQSVNLTVSASGSGTLGYQWYSVSGTTATAINGETSSLLRVTPVTTSKYRVRVSNGCGSDVTSSTATITVKAPPTAPGMVVAASNGAQNTITWSSSSSTVGIARYEVRRHNGPTYQVSMPASLSRTDSSGLVAGAAYLYEVRAVDLNGIASSWSAPDVTVTMLFTDDPIQPGVTMIDGSHIGQLRQAIDAMRQAAGLGAAWASHAETTGLVLGAHVSEMQTRLNEARAALGLTEVVFTVPAPPAGELIRAADIMELRGGVR